MLKEKSKDQTNAVDNSQVADKAVVVDKLGMEDDAKVWDMAYVLGIIEGLNYQLTNFGVLEVCPLRPQKPRFCKLGKRALVTFYLLQFQGQGQRTSRSNWFGKNR